MSLSKELPTELRSCHFILQVDERFALHASKGVKKKNRCHLFGGNQSQLQITPGLGVVIPDPR